MKKLGSITLIVALLIMTIPMLAQEDHRGRRGQNVKHISQELDLSDEQKAQVKEIVKSSRKSRKETFEASQDEVESKIREILSPEQLLTFDELKVEREEKKAKREEAKEAVQKFREVNVKPFILQKRMELEALLSAEDKATLSSIRSSMAVRLEGRSGNVKSKKKKSQRISKEDRQSLKAINEKYAEDINKLQDEIAAKQESWNKEMKAILKAYKWKEEGNEIDDKRLRARSPRNGKERRRGERGDMNNVRFLLMEVDN